MFKIAFLAVALSVTTLANGAGYTNNSTMTDTSANRAQDQAIANKIREKFGSGWFAESYKHVNLLVNNGVVTIEGSVKTFEDKEKVEREIRNVDGVKELNSQITITDQDSRDKTKKAFANDQAGTPSDEQLNKKIRDNVSRGWLWDSYKEVILNTNNGNVTLIGIVSAPSDQQKLINEIQKVEGVKSVKSNLKFKNP